MSPLTMRLPPVPWRTLARASGLFLLAAAAFAATVMSQSATFIPAADGASVRILQPTDGATVKRAFPLVMQVTGAQVKPSGFTERGAGHFHILIDEPAIAAGQLISGDIRHVHYERQQTEDNFYLAPGKHTLTLQFGDGDHRSFGPAMSHTITVFVEP